MGNHMPSRSLRRRCIELVILLLLTYIGYSLRLFQVQIVQSDAFVTPDGKTTTTQLTIDASRGIILDRYLKEIAVNRTSFCLVFDGATFPRGTSSSRRAQQTQLLVKLTALLSERGETWIDKLPISQQEPYTFSNGMDKSVSALKKMLELQDYATADNCMDALIKRYELEGLTAAQQRQLAGIQYSMELQGFSLRTPYTFSGDISRDTAYIIKENNTLYPGVLPQTTAVREYVNDAVGSHLIGTIGPIYAEEYEKLKDQGYRLNDVVGKSGVELALESTLRGTSGVRTIVRGADGEILKDYESQTAQAGNTVVLTLDMNLQRIAHEALDDKITQLRALTGTKTRPWVGQDVKSGSVVMLDVKTGGVLVCESWPGYDLNTYYAQYNELLNDPDNPLFNRALFGTYPNGSTMKPAIAIAALMDNIITSTSTPISCQKTYKYYAHLGFSPKCLGYHGRINVVKALQKSCNVFFYEMGRLLTIERMNYYCRYFGLGQKTGIEIGESAGILAGPEERQASGGVWSAGDTVTAAIGQSDNRFTPIQLAAYAMTLANNGVRYSTHLVHSILSYDGTLLSETKPEVLSSLAIPADVLQTVKEGMIAVTQSGGTAASAFAGATYTLAAKTGTAQGNSSQQSDHGVFIAYAPADDPQVAIAVLMENGTSGAASSVARTVLDAYFSSNASGEPPLEQKPLP